MTDDEKLEWLKCSESALYFLDCYCQIENPNRGGWIPFHLWPAQARTLRVILNNLLVIILKARQLGLTWLVLGYALWLMLFRPAATVLLFSKRDDEAINMLDDRLKGMYHRLPEFLQARAVIKDDMHVWELSNGSVARAFPTTGGDSYTATLAIVDEADLMPDFNRLMGSVKPTIDAGGQLIVLGRVDKTKPESEFKHLYRAAREGRNRWSAIFLAWHARPERDAAWYEMQRTDILARTGAFDDLHEQYPATDTEALAAKMLDKRIAPPWIEQCYVELPALTKLPENAPAIPGLVIYRLPEKKGTYVVGADPAEGNPTSDDSALTVLDDETGEEVASLAGKFQPSTLAAHIDQIGIFFNRAAVMCERNNHGHAVLLWLQDHSKLERLAGWDGKEGWLSNTKGKALLYDTGAEAFRDQATELHTFATSVQLAGIDGSTLRAPEGQRDDRADGYVLALAAIYNKLVRKGTGISV